VCNHCGLDPNGEPDQRSSRSTIRGLVRTDQDRVEERELSDDGIPETPQRGKVRLSSAFDNITPDSDYEQPPNSSSFGESIRPRSNRVHAQLQSLNDTIPPPADSLLPEDPRFRLATASAALQSEISYDALVMADNSSGAGSQQLVSIGVDRLTQLCQHLHPKCHPKCPKCLGPTVFGRIDLKFPARLVYRCSGIGDGSTMCTKRKKPVVNLFLDTAAPNAVHFSLNSIPVDRQHVQFDALKKCHQLRGSVTEVLCIRWRCIIEALVRETTLDLTSDLVFDRAHDVLPGVASKHQYKLARQLIHSATQRVHARVARAYTSVISAKSSVVEICLVFLGDGHWSHVRNALMCSYALMEFHSRKLIAVFTVSKNVAVSPGSEPIKNEFHFIEDVSSKSMEDWLLQKIKEYCIAHNLAPRVFVSDRVCALSIIFQLIRSIH
jgi:hypothetical protein